ncbi:shikimate kinase [Loigolactobacillus backii]|uniref:Shikimate kinase n=1 Tax=Loigolactobacillus backii TaxID=375175 RepID=A0A192H090_9LACO|nr:shikimate kinase [Loigolactobacillus backii]ANK60733.1 shikimate kinase [Loigolactobacillus backii]ANK61698.1 shikimate kinase [Loigolactobacillus backii]ANK65686.1 shikimate kinase [Loigolactobacillus backii]ANK68163.1 shikimate kinase [Loigolactobacillus backii]ANK69105.1 shikimate kinase [Loigolactobacillus backii]
MLTAILIGFMGTGKTTVGNVLAINTQQQQIDLDDEIVSAAGKSIKQVFAEDGEAAFRQLETTVLKTAFKRNGILSTGGGVIESETNRAVLEATEIPIIFLKTLPTVILERLTGEDAAVRPLVGQLGPAGLTRLWKKREPLYERISDLTILTDELTPEEVSERIETFLVQKSAVN